jgi:predicted ABC-type ATPase
VILVMIHLESPALNQARISERVSEEGHDVLSDKVVSPIPRMLHHVRMSLSLCDVARAYGNSSADHPFLPVFTETHGRMERHVTPFPDWADGLLAVF